MTASSPSRLCCQRTNHFLLCLRRPSIERGSLQRAATALAAAALTTAVRTCCGRLAVSHTAPPTCRMSTDLQLVQAPRAAPLRLLLRVASRAPDGRSSRHSRRLCARSLGSLTPRRCDEHISLWSISAALACGPDSSTSRLVAPLAACHSDMCSALNTGQKDVARARAQLPEQSVPHVS